MGVGEGTQNGASVTGSHCIDVVREEVGAPLCVM